jgi:hypothetical protein
VLETALYERRAGHYPAILPAAAPPATSASRTSTRTTSSTSSDYSASRTNSSKPFELQGDCLAEAWGNCELAEGKLQPADIEEAVGTALAVGTSTFRARTHTRPVGAASGWLIGFRIADPSGCARFVPANCRASVTAPCASLARARVRR